MIAEATVIGMMSKQVSDNLFYGDRCCVEYEGQTYAFETHGERYRTGDIVTITFDEKRKDRMIGNICYCEKDDIPGYEWKKKRDDDNQE